MPLPLSATAPPFALTANTPTAAKVLALTAVATLPSTSPARSVPLTAYWSWTRMPYPQRPMSQSLRSPRPRLLPLLPPSLQSCAHKPASSLDPPTLILLPSPLSLPGPCSPAAPTPLPMTYPLCPRMMLPGSPSNLQWLAVLMVGTEITILSVNMRR